MVEKSGASSFWPSLYEPFARAGARLSEWLAPASEAMSNDNAYTITVELPGVAEKDVTLDIHDGVLTLKGSKSSERKEEGATWYFSEREYGSFSRSFRLPPDADASGIAAQLKDGVLTVTVPRKATEAAIGTRVKIEQG